MLPAASRFREHPALLIAVAVGLAALLVVGVAFLLARPSPTAPGGPAETALRTLRLAGYDHAVVGEDGGAAIVRVSVPSIASQSDAELSWQTALAVAAEAYPSAERCVAQVFSGERPVLEVTADADDLRGARGAVPESASFAYLAAADEDARGAGQAPAEVAASPDSVRAARALREAAPEGATALPRDAVSIDLDIAGAYLDELNLVTGLVDDRGPRGFEPLAAAWRRARASAPGRPALRGETDPAAFYAIQLADALAGQRARGAGDLAARARAIAAGKPDASVPELRAWLFAAEAVAGETATASVVPATAAAVRRARAAQPAEDSPARGLLLAAAASAAAPRDAAVIADFTRTPSGDVTPTAAAPAPSASRGSVPRDVLARTGGRSLAWDAGGERASVSPAAWLAYTRAGDDRVYWLAGPGGPAALTDGTLRGWAFTIPRAWLVEPGAVGRILAEYPTG